MISRPAPLSSLFKGLTAIKSGLSRVKITEQWMQGRTTYGGCSAAICLEAARQTLGPNPPPLRSVQVSFVGAAGGDAEVATSIVRQGKAMTFVRGEVFSGGKLATTALFAFGAPRESSFDETFIPPPPPDLPGVGASPSLFEGPFPPPVFTNNFEARLALGGHPASGSEALEHLMWVRHVGATEEGGVENVADEVAFLALADMPPPAAFPRLSQPAPVSSVTWQLNFLEESRCLKSEPGGWWLLGKKLGHMRRGYSSESLTVWGLDGRCMAVGMQTMAIYA